MQIVNITTNNVDIELLNKQRIELHELLLKTEPTGNGDLWGLLGLLDHICDKYESVLYSTDLGECDTCGGEYELSSRDGRCGDCGECADHCTHENGDNNE